MIGLAGNSPRSAATVAKPMMPAPTTRTLAFFSRFWPVIPTSGMIR